MKHWLIAIIVTIVLILTMNHVGANIPIDHRSTLTGKVSAVGLVQVGQEVKEGTPLVNIDEIIGTVPTTRATVDGVVVAVYVKPGDLISTNQVVLKIERR